MYSYRDGAEWLDTLGLCLFFFFFFFFYGKLGSLCMTFMFCMGVYEYWRGDYAIRDIE